MISRSLWSAYMHLRVNIQPWAWVVFIFSARVVQNLLTEFDNSLAPLHLSTCSFETGGHQKCDPLLGMAKSDFNCNICKKVISKDVLDFFNVTTLHKFKCPKCGTICNKHVDHRVATLGLLKPKCKKCGSKVIAYKFENGKWTQC